LAVYLAKGERRRTLRNVGWAFIVGGLVLLVARRLAGQAVVDALSTPSSHDASHRAWLIGTSILAQIGWAAILYGVVVVLATAFAGPAGAATAVRRRTAPVLNEHAGAAWAAVGCVYLLLVLWGPTHALRVAWGIALLAVLLAAGLVALRRQTLREFPGTAGVTQPVARQVTQAPPPAGAGEPQPPATVAHDNER
jgi:hypothetical protein